MAVLATCWVGDSECTLSSRYPKQSDGSIPTMATYEFWAIDGVTGQEYKRTISGEANAYAVFAAFITMGDVAEVVNAADMLRNDPGLTGMLP